MAGTRQIKIIEVLSAIFLVLCLPSCEKKPNSPLWIDVSEDYGFIVYEGRFIEPPTLPISVCIADGQETLLVENVRAIAQAVAYWHLWLGNHIKCPIFEPQPIGAPCAIQLHDSRSLGADWNPDHVAIAVPMVNEEHPNRISECEILFSEATWAQARPDMVVAHELGHCLGLSDDPLTGDVPASVMQAYSVPWEQRLTAKDARLIIKGHRCRETP